MKSIVKSTIVLAFLYLSTGCSKEFLNDILSQDSLPVGLSNIYISPDWQVSNYIFILPSIKNDDYQIVSKPSWLNIGSLSGHLSDSTAIVECSATENAAFNTPGVYLDFMTVSAEGKNFKVPTAYINEGNPKLQVQSDLTLTFNNTYFTELPIYNAGLGVLLWEIRSMPDWLVLDSALIQSANLFISPYTKINIPLIFRFNAVYTGIISGKIVLSTNDKEHSSVSVNVTIDMGIPQLSINTKSMYFNYTEAPQTLYFSNSGTGPLAWEFKNVPDWLTITPSSGVYNSYGNGGYISVSCDPSKLSPGQNSAILNLNTNDSSHLTYNISVTAIAPGLSLNTRAIEGNIIDAVFNRNTNTLYYVTSTPNKFVAYDVINRNVVNEILLKEVPTCFAISEDWSKVAIGHNGSISSINLTSNSITATYTLGYTVYDIAWAENDWFCFTQTGSLPLGLHWINMADGTLYDEPNRYGLDGKTIIKKVPSQPYLIATRTNTSPSGVLAYDISSKSLKSYSPMDLTKFWFSENGDYIFAKNLNIYLTTSSTGSNNLINTPINSIGSINTGNVNYNELYYVYQSDHYLWVIQNGSFSVETNCVYQIEANDYTLVKKYNYDWVFQPDAQTPPFNARANYVFVNNEGTEIAVLCKGTSNDSWIIQFIPVEK